MNVKCKEHFLKLGMWNVEGLTSVKAPDPQFQNIVSNLSIISFVETWLGDNYQDVTLSEFQLVHSSSRKKTYQC